MNTDLARATVTVDIPAADELSHMMEVVRSISTTDFVPRAYRGNNAAILACILTGRGLGLDPMHSLRSINLVDGKASLSAELMVALVRRAGHSIVGESSVDKCVVTGRRGDNGDEFSVTYTLDEARTAGLVEKANWKKHPADMLWSRAVSRLCRRLFADVLAGAAYVPEEVTLTAEERNAAVTEALPLPPDEDASLSEAGAGGDVDATTLADKGPVEARPTVASPVSESEDAQPGEQTALTVPNDVRKRMENGE